MPAPKLYQFTDGNAPVCSGTRGALINILKKCLIDGYGDKIPVGGWTVEFENAESTIAVFRNNPLTGTGFFLRVNESTTANAFTVELKGYELMTDIDNGTGLFQWTTNTFAISNGANTTARPWLLVADEKAFYFHCHTAASTVLLPTDGTGAQAFFFGDIITLRPTDEFGCLLAKGDTNASQTITVCGGINSGFFPSSLGQSPLMRMPRAASAFPGAVGCCLGNGPPSQVAQSMPTNAYGAGIGGAVKGETDPVFIYRPYISEQTAYTVRGWVPGLYWPGHAVRFNPFYILNDSGKTFITCSILGPNNYNNTTQGQYLISLDDWRA